MSLGFNIYDVQFNAVGMKIMEPFWCQNIPLRTCGTFAKVSSTTKTTTDNLINIDSSKDNDVSLEFQAENYNSFVLNRVIRKTNKEIYTNARLGKIPINLQTSLCSYLRQRCLYRKKFKKTPYQHRAIKKQGDQQHHKHTKHWHTHNLNRAE